MSNEQSEPGIPDGSYPRDAAAGSPDGGDGQRRRGAVVTGSSVAIAAALAGAAIAHFAWAGGSPSSPTSSTQGASTAAESVSGLASRVDVGIVDVNTVLSDGAAAGTGMVVTSSGEVITNNHVIDGATKISATDVASGKTYSARVVGYDQTKDVAVIQLIGARNLRTVTLGNSSSVRIGQSIVTIGNAGGAGGIPSAASGTVTALGRSITASDDSSGSSEQLTGLIELNGSLEPGDSGGPLVNSAGEVIGMDTAASSGFSFQSSGTQGFAIPINDVVRTAGEIEHGTSTNTIHVGATALIGVGVESGVPTGNYAYGYGYGKQVDGAYVTYVATGSPAASAGIEPGDTITALGGRAVSSATGLTDAKDRFNPGARVSITWTDANGNSHSATIKLTSGPAD